MADEQNGVPTLPGEPDGSLVPIVRGAIKFYSERSEPRPWNNCEICSAMSCLRWMGYDVPEGYDDVIRAAIPLPDYVLDKNGKPVLDKDGNKVVRGTTAWEVQKGIEALFTPATTVEKLTDAEFLGMLKRVDGRGRGKSVFCISVFNTDKLPPHYQRLVGQNYDAGHGIAVTGKTEVNGVLHVYILDPMGKSKPGVKDNPQTFEPYKGELIPWDDLKPAIRLRDGLILCIRGVKNGARVHA